ncbi:radical SAM protein [Mitsuaria sp. WAJ17]|uniref:radical SAM protein n=1 Tax=Mitsuaria sp. WAJ17 TaxID=2761452 RepID=UPI001600D84A|nr:radical SAM protein [Mitsuaria sp. WAJ17]MBB2483837.1 radical SAM protein [Mitsuaria sp. WAJ17]
MTRKTRPYLFYDTTQSVCTQCLRPVEAKILIKDEQVFMDKWCPAHGTERVLMADDAAYYRLCREVFVKAPEMPQRFATPMQHGCPYDCGLCPDHMQHSCLSVVEITDHCNLRCPTCYAGSGPERLTHRSLEEVIAMLDTVVASEGEADVVQISGGEPTLHPQLFEILDAARARPIRHLMLNTNGLRIAQEPGFAERLAAYAPGFEVYLQFDSLQRDPLLDLRGADLRRIRAQALERLEAVGLSTTLVMTVKRGVNDEEIGDIIRHASTWRCVRGVTLQPVQNAGRVEAYEAARHRLTVSEIRRRIVEQSGVFTAADVVPVPCNPDTLAMAYALRGPGGSLQPLTRFLDPQTLVEGAANTIVFERQPDLKAQVFKLFSTQHSPQSQASCLSELMCCLPQISAPADLSYRDVFRVLIVQFMDAQSLDIRALKKSCIHMAQPDGRMIPFESYNLFYRDGLEADLLAPIRAELAVQHAQRRATGLQPVQPPARRQA